MNGESRTPTPSSEASEPPRWVHVHSKDELEAFYRGVLPNIITEAKYHGYAIGVHGSLRRDLDLIAVPWSDDHSDRDELARAIQEAACGMPMERYQWEEKPCGRFAVSFPVCWTEKSETFLGETNLGHIDLSVMASKSETSTLGIQWRLPDTARASLEPEFDETGAVDGCVVKLDASHERHDGGPYIRQAWYDSTQGGFVCSATGTALPNVKAWAYDAEAE